MAEEKKIATGYIGNALRSSAADHTTTFTDEIFDTERQKYQNEVNTDLETTDNEIKADLEAEKARAMEAEEANTSSIDSLEKITSSVIIQNYTYKITEDNPKIGDIVTLTQSAHNGAIIPVKTGDKVSLKGQSVGSLRVYFILDSDNKILDLSPADSKVLDKTFIVESDGTLYYSSYRDYQEQELYVNGNLIKSLSEDISVIKPQLLKCYSLGFMQYSKDKYINQGQGTSYYALNTKGELLIKGIEVAVSTFGQVEVSAYICDISKSSYTMDIVKTGYVSSNNPVLYFDTPVKVTDTIKLFIKGAINYYYKDKDVFDNEVITIPSTLDKITYNRESSQTYIDYILEKPTSNYINSIIDNETNIKSIIPSKEKDPSKFVNNTSGSYYGYKIKNKVMCYGVRIKHMAETVSIAYSPDMKSWSMFITKAFTSEGVDTIIFERPILIGGDNGANIAINHLQYCWSEGNYSYVSDAFTLKEGVVTPMNKNWQSYIEYLITGTSVGKELSVLEDKLKHKPYIVVDIKGGGDFISLWDAMVYAGDRNLNSEAASVIVVAPGTYIMPEVTTETRPYASWRNISIIGLNKNTCIIKNTKGYYKTGDDFHDCSPLQLAGNCYIANLTIISTAENYPASLDATYKRSYCIHIDSEANEGDVMEVHNCSMYNDHSRCIGCGLRKDFTLKLTNCECKTINDTSNNEGLWTVGGHDGGDYEGQKVIIKDCFIENVGGKYGINWRNAYNGHIDITLINNTVIAPEAPFMKVDDYHTLTDCSHGNNHDSMNVIPIKVDYIENDLGYAIYSEAIAPSTGSDSVFYLSARRSTDGIAKIKATAWGLASHIIFCAFDSEGSPIESSKIFGKDDDRYTKKTFEVEILPEYKSYIVGHIVNQTGVPENTEASLIEYSVKETITIEKVNEKVEELSAKVNIVNYKIIDSTMFGGNATDGDYINENGELDISGDCNVTDFIDCSGYNQIEVNLSAKNLIYCAFYLSDKKMFSLFQTGASTESIRLHKIIAIPNGVKYVRLSNIKANCNNPNAILRKVKNWWENRKIAIFGTSISAGYPLGCYEQQIAEGKQDIYSFVNVAIRNIGAIPLNFSVPSGAMRASKVDGTVNAAQYAFASDDDILPDFGDNGLQNVTYKNSMLPLIDTDDEPDLFLFANYGSNDTVYDNTDFAEGYTPDYTSIQPNTFVGAFNKVLKALYEAYPYARVAIMTTTRDATGDNVYIKNANNQLVELARLWEAPCMELHKITGLICNGIVDNRANWIQSYDKVHPANFNKKKGVEFLPRLAKLTEEWLMSIS